MPANAKSPRLLKLRLVVGSGRLPQFRLAVAALSPTCVMGCGASSGAGRQAVSPQMPGSVPKTTFDNLLPSGNKKPMVVAVGESRLGLLNVLCKVRIA